METVEICLFFIFAELAVALLVARFCGINHLDDDE